MKRFLLWMLLICVLPLAASIDEDSAMANALSGLSLLSNSVADYRISPVMQIRGFCTNYMRPFNSPDISIYGLHNAISLNNLFIGVGNSYLYHSDYTKHNTYLNAHYLLRGISVGATGHMIYDSVAGEDGEYEWYYDLGTAFNRGSYAAEIKLLRCKSPLQQTAYSLKGSLSEDLDAALGYVQQKEQNDYFRVAVTANLLSLITLYGSWQSDPNRFGMGVQVNTHTWSLMYSIRSHSTLDPGHAVSLDIYW
ncbi:MAG: hypothetical protein PHQ78_03220 [Candidatus Cloacimonetes bacterium]|jgi:hypothetical protein|nr:hypothetical protein [Candidatus Cloacimonadota bacterium]MDD2506309.1 hypothetical protein [Candidatus Cloacimonadota bacterium]MDD4559871.1 hypothetical protein [Candidatus Cloacimonadota bacterium]